MFLYMIDLFQELSSPYRQTIVKVPTMVNIVL